jgi:hypothetical protein
MIESIIARCTEPNEVIVNIDDAEAFGWEFDEFAMEQPLKKSKKAKAVKPVTVAPPVEEVDDAMPTWMADEVGECFGDDAVWTA